MMRTLLLLVLYDCRLRCREGDQSAITSLNLSRFNRALQGIATECVRRHGGDTYVGESVGRHRGGIG